MSQNDFVIANQSAPDFRSDLNAALQALASLSSGAAAPATTYANMLWYDTANNILKMRSEADDAWTSIGYLDQTTNAFRILDDTQVVNTGGTQTGLIGDQSTATWEAGTGTTESLVSPAKVKAAIDAFPQSPRLISTTVLSGDQSSVSITGLDDYRHIMVWTDADITSNAIRELQVGSGAGFVSSGYICEEASDRDSIRLHTGGNRTNQSGVVIIYNFGTTDAVKPVINAISRNEKVTAIGSATAFDRVRFTLSEPVSEYENGSRFLVWGWN